MKKILIIGMILTLMFKVEFTQAQSSNACFTGKLLQFGGIDYDYGTQEIDQMGNVITLISPGSSQSIQVLDSTIDVSSYLFPTVLVSISPNFTINWIKIFSNGNLTKKITIDPLNNIYLTGSGTITLDNTTYGNNTDNFIMKINNTATSIQVQTISNSSNFSLNNFRDITTDAIGNIFVAGHNSMCIFGNDTVYDYYILKFDNSLNYVSNCFFNDNYNIPYFRMKLKTDNAGNVILLLDKDQNKFLNFNNNDTLIQPGFSNSLYVYSILLSISNDLSTVNFSYMKGDLNNNFWRMDNFYVTPSNEIFVTYNNFLYNQSIIINNDTIITSSNNNNFLIKLSPTGNEINYRTFPNQISAVAVNGSDMYISNSSIKKLELNTLADDSTFIENGLTDHNDLDELFIYNNKLYACQFATGFTFNLQGVNSLGYNDLFIGVYPLSFIRQNPTTFYLKELNYVCGEYMQNMIFSYNWAQNVSVQFNPANNISLDDYLQINSTFTDSDTVFYTITDNIQNCTITDTLFVHVNPMPTVSLINYAGKTDFCYGETFSIGFGVPAYFHVPQSYLWSNGDTSAIISGHTSGAYYCEATDTDGCHLKSDTIEINVHMPPVVNVTPQDSIYEICPGDSLVLFADSGNYIYWWNTGSTNNSTIITQPGLYTVNVYDQYGCEGNAGININYACVGIVENVNMQNIKLYPNPASQVMNLTGENLEGMNIEIYDLKGKMIFKDIISAETIYQKDLSEFTAGIYIVKLIDDQLNYNTYKLNIIK